MKKMTKKSCKTVFSSSGKTKWEDVVMNLQANQPDQNCDEIKEFVMAKLRKEIYMKMQNEIHGITMVGQDIEF